MRDGSSQGLTLPLGYIKKMLKNREVSERKQVGDAEALVNQGRIGSGVAGFSHEGEL